MKEYNSSGIAFDVEDLKSQMKVHVLNMRNNGDLRYSIEKAMKKIGLSKAGYFEMIKRGTIRQSSIKKFSKLKIGSESIVVKTLG